MKLKKIAKSQIFKLEDLLNFTMDNSNLRVYLSKNRYFVELFKMTHRNQNFSDTWLAIKFMEYNSLLDEIRDQFKQVSKSINTAERDRIDRRDEFLEEVITPQIYKILFGRD